MTTFRASLSTTSWPGFSSSSSIPGLTLTRIFRPPVNTSAVPSSQALRKTPKPEGGWASLSTSSLSATIWSLASRSVLARRSFCPVTLARLVSVSRSRSSSSRDCTGESASRRRSAAISSSRKEICVVRTLTSSSCRAARALSSRAAMAPHPFRELTYLDPTYPGCVRNLARALRRPAPPWRRRDTVCEPPRGHQEAGVPDHAVLWPDGKPVDMPATDQRFRRGRLGEAALLPQRLHGP